MPKIGVLKTAGAVRRCGQARCPLRHPLHRARAVRLIRHLLGRSEAARLLRVAAIDPHMQQLGFDTDRYEFHPYTGAEHDIHDIPLVDGWAAEFLARQFCGGNTSIAGGTQTAEAIVIQRGGNLEVVSAGELGSS